MWQVGRARLSSAVVGGGGDGGAHLPDGRGTERRWIKLAERFVRRSAGLLLDRSRDHR